MKSANRHRRGRHRAGRSSRAPDDTPIILIAGPFKKYMVELADTLLGAHRTVVWLSSCAEAIRSLSERTVELILSARVLVDGDWTVLLRGIAEMRRRPPLVLISGDHNPVLDADAVRLGAASCVSALSSSHGRSPLPSGGYDPSGSFRRL
jgi:hypothetical protein